jgi:hypothetical protein
LFLNSPRLPRGSCSGSNCESFKWSETPDV